MACDVPECEVCETLEHDEVIVHHTTFEPGRCPSCHHPQHVGSYCMAGKGTPDFCGCTPESAIKQTKGKTKGWALLAWDVIPEIIDIYNYGIKKGYLKDSWRNVAPEEYEDALMRHVTKHLQGEVYDTESKKRHIAHAAWNCIAVMALRK